MTRIATCAYPGTHDVRQSIRRHEAYIQEAAAAGASLVVFPETSLQGYPPDLGGIGPEAVVRQAQRSAERVPDGPSVQRIVEAASRHRIHVVFGLTEQGDRPGVLYNTLVLAGPDGVIGSYRKVHVCVLEKLIWRPGDHWPVFETALGNIGLLICYDKAWPESTRELTLAGADILVVGAAWSSRPLAGSGEQNANVRSHRLYDAVRAMENGRWLVSSNFVGDLGGCSYFGLSQIVDPRGDVTASTGYRAGGACRR